MSCHTSRPSSHLPPFQIVDHKALDTSTAMEVNLVIKSLILREGQFDCIFFEGIRAEEEITDSVRFVLPKFHDTLIGEVRIVLKKSAFPWPMCVGVAVLRNSSFRTEEEGKRYTASILHRRYYGRASSHEFVEREMVGEIEYEFTRKMLDDPEAMQKHKSVGVVEKMFEFFLSEEKAGMMLSIKKLMDYLSSGSHNCRVNIFVGAVLLESHMSKLNARHSSNIELALRAEDKSDGSGMRESVERAINEKGLTGPNAVTIERAFEIIGADTEKDPKDHFELLMVNEGYKICTLQMLLRLRRLFCFALASYANSWIGHFLEPQRRVEGAIPDDRRKVLEMADIEDSELLRICLGPTEVVQHIVFYDKSERRLVVSFKGTTNSEETLQDINCEYAEFGDGYVHKGIREYASIFIRKHLDRVRELARAVESTKLLLTGHSLGGAISILLKIIADHENLLEGIETEVVAFSSPPVLSLELARRPCEGITIINYGNDIISRMSFGSILDLKYLCCSIGENNASLLLDRQIGGDIKTVMDHLKKSALHPKLYSPRKLIHLKRIRCTLNDNRNPILAYREVEPEFFEEIILIKHAGKHHAPSHIIDVLDCGVRQYSSTGRGK
jgi:hypothetical protein